MKIAILKKELMRIGFYGKRNYKAEDGSDLKAIFDNYISVGIVSNIA